MKSLDGTIATLKFDPADPASVKAAIREMEKAVDSKLSAYRNNPLVSKIAAGSKEQFRKAIQKRATGQ